ncbi:hypothetical protein LV779_17915 [Streptomyces thinghirensis]|nr:hypothetical protein [Streptomyces thinghirensis]
MSGDEPYAEHDGALLLLLILAGLVTVVWLTVRAITGLVRARRNGTALLGPATVLAWDATVGMYTWGAAPPVPPRRPRPVPGLRAGRRGQGSPATNRPSYHCTSAAGPVTDGWSRRSSRPTSTRRPYCSESALSS